MTYVVFFLLRPLRCSFYVTYLRENVDKFIIQMATSTKMTFLILLVNSFRISSIFILFLLACFNIAILSQFFKSSSTRSIPAEKCSTRSGMTKITFRVGFCLPRRQIYLKSWKCAGVRCSCTKMAHRNGLSVACDLERERKDLRRIISSPNISVLQPSEGMFVTKICKV